MMTMPEAMQQIPHQSDWWFRPGDSLMMRWSVSAIDDHAAPMVWTPWTVTVTVGSAAVDTGQIDVSVAGTLRVTLLSELTEDLSTTLYSVKITNGPTVLTIISGVLRPQHQEIAT